MTSYRVFGILFIRSKSNLLFHTQEEGITQEYKYHEAEIIGDHLWGHLSTSLFPWCLVIRDS